MLSLIEPNIHPILVHFAYALSITATGLYVLAKVPFAGNRVPFLRQSADLIFTPAIIAVILTVGAGFQAYFTVGHDGPSHEAMTVHRNWALGSAVFLILMALWRWVKRAVEPSAGFVAAMIVSAALLTTTAWWGGHIVYGYGIGVKQLPQISGPGHDHHGGGEDNHGAGPGVISHGEMPMSSVPETNVDEVEAEAQVPQTTNDPSLQNDISDHGHDDHAH